MSVAEAIILGVVQGLAEFLPVSSSGHLQIAKEVLGVTLTDNLTFDVMLHVATVLATVVVLWKEVAGLFKGLGTGLFRWTWNPQTEYVAKLLLSMIPVALVGLLLRDQINAMLSSPAILLIVGVMLLVTAGLLLFAGRARERKQEQVGQKGKKGVIPWRDAFVIGLAQAAAAMPGLSRSGATIATGLVLGNKKAAVAQFSFLMVIVPILGEALLDVIRNYDFARPAGGGLFSLSLSGAGVFPYVAGFAAAFAVGCAACRFMIEMVKRSKLVWFAVYCALAGAASIVYYFV